MGQTSYELEHSVQHEEHGTGIDVREGQAFVGGLSLECPLPEEGFVFRFEPVPIVLQAESFETESTGVLITRLFMVFGAFDLVAVSTGMWSVEDHESIYGTVSIIGGRKHSFSEHLAAYKENPSEHDSGNCRAESIGVNHVTEASP